MAVETVGLSSTTNFLTLSPSKLDVQLSDCLNSAEVAYTIILNELFLFYCSIWHYFLWTLDSQRIHQMKATLLFGIIPKIAN